jgi:hypothetical protein
VQLVGRRCRAAGMMAAMQHGPAGQQFPKVLKLPLKTENQK